MTRLKYRMAHASHSRCSLCTWWLHGEVSGLNLNSSKTESLWIAGAGSTPWDKGRGGGGVVPKKLFWGLKISGWRASGPLPWIRQCIGSNTGKNEILAPERNFKWQKDKVRSLGLLFSSDPTNEATIKETNKLFYSLFWNGKNNKIKLDIMINNYPDGGLKMVDVESFNKALKVTWVILKMPGQKQSG